MSAALQCARTYAMAEEAHPFTIRIETDRQRRLRRYRWTISDSAQIHLRSPESYTTRRGAKENGDKALLELVAELRNRE